MECDLGFIYSLLSQQDFAKKAKKLAVDCLYFRFKFKSRLITKPSHGEHP